MYETSDLSLASTLVLTFPMQSISKENPRKALFVFNDSPELQQMVTDYWAGKLKLEPQAMFNSMRTLKARIYGE